MLKEKKIYILCLLFFIISCNKKETYKENETFSSSVSHFTDLNKYKINKKIINDSIIYVEGKNINYQINGFLERRSNKKVNWWKIVDLKDSTNKLKIQYSIIDSQSIANQILAYKKGKLDTFNSKFYTLKSINNNIKYSFYFPQRKTSPISNKFYYQIDGNEYNEICKKNFNHYECIIRKPNHKNVLGLFTEATSKGKDSINMSEIFTEDFVK